MSIKDSIDYITKFLEKDISVIADEDVKPSYNAFKTADNAFQKADLAFQKADLAFQKADLAFEKATLDFKKSLEPFSEINYAKYIELKRNLKGKTAKTKLPATIAVFENHGVRPRRDASGKILWRVFIIEACKKNVTGAIIKELNRTPEDAYREDMNRIARMDDVNKAKLYIDEKYNDNKKLKKFLTATKTDIGEKGKKFDRAASIQNIMYKLPDIKAQIDYKT